jgi:hypothetical protein
MSRLYEAVMGLVVADALGVPAEFEPRDSYQVTEMTGYGTHRQLPGNLVGRQLHDACDLGEF